ncbi:MAG TPA: hypothetical protein VNA25_24090 [Phycisphaerae bacterium]|nr:hypothetical protein [Phycisphaerae bacterium]
MDSIVADLEFVICLAVFFLSLPCLAPLFVMPNLIIGLVIGFHIYFGAAFIVGKLAKRKNHSETAWALVGGLVFAPALVVLAFEPFLCPKCGLPLTDTQWKNKTCYRCDSFAAPTGHRRGGLFRALNRHDPAASCEKWEKG